ncbi:hypothetical protein [Lysinibacter cavernae]|uniref:Uncharacterized protein n=1 Tax=Lysinibacter cavernae TaxID=1640652 RepID=A0A7X5R2Q7_9MICO|nr:hypothetical protein [Lysinibacter cavernae]NIH54476.1 hypothetical protein [Lysinibacter cavernae]
MNQVERPRRISGAMLACAIAASLLVGGWITAVARVDAGAAIPWGAQRQDTVGGAKLAVATYLSYLATGDADAATRMADPEADAECGGFLSDAVFAKAKEHISEVEVTGAVQDGDTDRYRVSVEYVLGGVDYRAYLEASYWKGWRVEPMTRALSVSAMKIDGGQATLNVSGIDLAVDQGSYCDWAAYPAIYQLNAPSHGLVVADPVDLPVSFASDEDSELEVSLDGRYTLKSRILSTVESETVDLVDSCLTVEGLFTRQSGKAPCAPFQLYSGKSDVTDLRVEVLEYPVITLTGIYSDGATYSADGGEIRLSYSAIDTYDKAAGVKQFTDVEVDLMQFSSSYAVTFVDGELVFGWPS